MDTTEQTQEAPSSSITRSATVGTISNLWNDCYDSERRQHNVEALNYVRGIAASTGVNINRWNILKLLRVAYNSNDLITDRREINRRFFNKIEAMNNGQDTEETEVDPSTIEINEQLATAFNNLYANRFEQSIQSLKDHIENAQSRAARAMSDYESFMEQVVDNQQALQILETTRDNQDDTIGVAQLQEILASGQWENPVFQEDYDDPFIWLNTVNNCIVRYNRPNLGIDIVQDLGQMAVRFNIRTIGIVVFPFKHNKKCNGYYHPHVSELGAVCWGQARDHVIELQTHQKFAELFALLHDLLNSYCPDAPYVDIVTFSENARRFNAIPANLRHPNLRGE